MGRYLAADNLHIIDGGIVGIAYRAGCHGSAVNNRVFQREVAYFRVGDAAEKPYAKALRLIDAKIGDGVAVAVKGSGKGITGGRNLLLLRLHACRHKNTGRRPLLPGEIHIRRQHIVSAEIIQHAFQLLRGGNLNGTIRR